MTKELTKFAPDLRAHLHHGNERLAGDALVDVAQSSDVVVTSYDIATRDVETLSAFPGPPPARRSARREEPGNEARASNAPYPARRKVAMTARRSRTA